MLTLSLFLHVLAAILWVGGMLFLTLVIAPFLGTIDDEAKRAELYQAVGARYRFWGWVAIAVLVVTGALNLYLMGASPAVLLDLSFLSTPYGLKLGLKVGLVIIVVAVSVLHDFWLGPRARHSKSFTFATRWLGRLNLLLVLMIVLLAVMLRTGGA